MKHDSSFHCRRSIVIGPQTFNSNHCSPVVLSRSMFFNHIALRESNFVRQILSSLQCEPELVLHTARQLKKTSETRNSKITKGGKGKD